MIYLTNATIIPYEDNNLEKILIHKLLNIKNNKYVTNLDRDQIKQIHEINKNKSISKDATRINVYELIKENGLKDITLFFNSKLANKEFERQIYESLKNNNITFTLKYETIDYNQGYILNWVDNIENLFLKHLNNDLAKDKHYLVTIYVEDNIKSEFKLFNWKLEECLNDKFKVLKKGLLISPYEEKNKWFIANEYN